jgi:hypothetical protein
MACSSNIAWDERGTNQRRILEDESRPERGMRTMRPGAKRLLCSAAFVFNRSSSAADALPASGNTP